MRISKTHKEWNVRGVCSDGGGDGDGDDGECFGSVGKRDIIRLVVKFNENS